MSLAGPGANAVTLVLSSTERETKMVSRGLPSRFMQSYRIGVEMCIGAKAF